MDRLEEIAARYSAEMSGDDYKKLRIKQIARMRLDVKQLLAENIRIRAELERTRKDRDDAVDRARENYIKFVRMQKRADKAEAECDEYKAALKGGTKG